MRRTGSCSLPPLREREDASSRTFPSFSLRTVPRGVWYEVARDSGSRSLVATGILTMSPTRSSRRSALTMAR
jgi:hypothetical protein